MFFSIDKTITKELFFAKHITRLSWMVPGAGLEPARPFGQRILSPCSVILSNTYISYIGLFKGL